MRKSLLFFCPFFFGSIFLFVDKTNDEISIANSYEQQRALNAIGCAPAVDEVKGKYYMFYSAQWKVNPTKELENFRIGVAVADKPSGPFIDMMAKPIFDPGYPIIDANVFFDKNGKCYLYFSRCAYKHPVESDVAKLARKKGWFKEIEESWVYGIELKPDGSFCAVVVGPKTFILPFFTCIRSINTTLSSPVFAVLP